MSDTSYEDITKELLDLIVELRCGIRSVAKQLDDDTLAHKEVLFLLLDKIRVGLKENNIILEDRPSGTTWRIGKDDTPTYELTSNPIKYIDPETVQYDTKEATEAMRNVIRASNKTSAWLDELKANHPCIKVYSNLKPNE